MSEREGGVCSRSEAHHGQKIQYVCLEESCELSRLLCKSCVTESHRRHKVGIIDKLIPPLSRLSLNSHHPHSEQDYAFFEDKIRSIVQVLVATVRNGRLWRRCSCGASATSTTAS